MTPGHRTLSIAEMELIGRIRELGNEAERLIDLVRSVTEGEMTNPSDDPERRLLMAHAEPLRWVAVGRTHFQEGLMALTRAVAKPTHF